jgi:hypothetical protein
VIGFLRFVGLVNAAVWLGAAVFFVLTVPPAFSAANMKQLLTGAGVREAIEQILWNRFFVVHHVCGAIALVHLLAEWLYTSKALERFLLGLVLGIFSLGLLSGLWLQPRLEKLNYTRHFAPAIEQKEAADRSFRFWKGAMQALNLAMTLGLLVYFWRLSAPPAVPRFSGAGKYPPNLFRG